MSRPSKPDSGLLEEIFPPQRIARDEIGGCNPELRDYIRDFGDRTWQEVSNEAYLHNDDAYNLMDPETLIHFIPGFMNYSLSSNYAWPLVYFACSDRFCVFCRLLNQEQRDYLISVVDHFICDEDDFSDEQRQSYQENRRKLT